MRQVSVSTDARYPGASVTSRQGLSIESPDADADRPERAWQWTTLVSNFIQRKSVLGT